MEMTSIPTQWFVVNHFDEDRVIRGPYVTQEAAAAVRIEVERQHNDDETWNENHNLWVVER